VEATFTVPKSGDYVVLVKYAAGIDTSRSLLLDGRVPFREAGYIPFTFTGGWSTEKNDWRFVFLGAEVPGVNLPWRVFLPAGTHTLRLDNAAGGGFNLDWLALVPPGMTREQAVSAFGDKDAHNGPPRRAVIHDWHGLFWYDPTVPAAKRGGLPRHRDNEDLGLYTARSSWTDPHATFLGYKCGPAAGESVLRTFGLLISGHTEPDQGSVVFYYGPHAVLPAPGYAHPVRLTQDHSVTVLESVSKKSPGRLVGQYGEGGQWFSNAWKYIRSSPTTLRAEHAPGYDTFLSELGGIYQPTGGYNAKTQAPNTLLSYQRSVTYLPTGVLVIVDKLEAPTPQTFDFRLLTEARDMTQQGRTFDFTVAGTPGRIVDFSPQPCQRIVTREKVNAWNNAGNDPTARAVATLKAAGRAEAIFAAVLGMNGAEKGVTVQADGNGIVIGGVHGGPIRLDWMPQARPLAADPTKPAPGRQGQ